MRIELEKVEPVGDSKMIGFETEGIPELREKLKRLGGTEPRREMSEDVAKMLRDEMQKYPPMRHVTRKQAYGRSFESDKQRRWFFASLADGSLTLPYRRTGQYRLGWEVMPFGATNYIVVNDHPAAKYLQDAPTQSRMAKLIGWKTWQEILQRKSDKIRYTANRVLDKWVRKLRL